MTIALWVIGIGLVSFLAALVIGAFIRAGKS